MNDHKRFKSSEDAIGDQVIRETTEMHMENLVYSMLPKAVWKPLPVEQLCPTTVVSQSPQSHISWQSNLAVKELIVTDGIWQPLRPQEVYYQSYNLHNFNNM